MNPPGTGTGTPSHPYPPHKPSIAITHLSADATFLLTYLPFQSANPPSSSLQTPPPPPFTVLLDPWLVGDSPVYHRSFSTQSHTVPPSITHLSQLAHAPSVVLISQDKTDHCHEETLRQLDAAPGGRDAETRVFAVKGAAGRVRGWKIFGEGKVEELKAWKAGGKVVRVEIPIAEEEEEVGEGEGEGEQAAEIAGGGRVKVVAHMEITHHPAVYPWEVPVLHSALGIRFVTTYTYHTPSPTPSPSPASTPEPQTHTHTHLTLFSPHGVSPPALLRYLTHISPPPATPHVDVLLHPFTLTTTPAHLGGKITLGLPNIAKVLRSGVRVRVVVSAHDEVKEVGGYVKSRIKTRRWDRGAAEREIWEGALRGGEGEGDGEGDGEGGVVVGKEGLPEVWDLGNGEVRECVL